MPNKRRAHKKTSASAAASTASTCNAASTSSTCNAASTSSTCNAASTFSTCNVASTSSTCNAASTASTADPDDHDEPDDEPMLCAQLLQRVRGLGLTPQEEAVTPYAATSSTERMLVFVFLVMVRLCVDAAGGKCDLSVIDGVLTMTEWLSANAPAWVVQDLWIVKIGREKAKSTFGDVWRLARPLQRDGCQIVDALWEFSEILHTISDTRDSQASNKIRALVFEMWCQHTASMLYTLSDEVDVTDDDDRWVVHFSLWACGTLYETKPNARSAWRYLPESRRAEIEQRFPDDPDERHHWSEQFRGRMLARRAIVNTINVLHGKCTACGRTPSFSTPRLLLCSCGCHTLYCNTRCQKLDRQRAKARGDPVCGVSASV